MYTQLQQIEEKWFPAKPIKLKGPQFSLHFKTNISCLNEQLQSLNLNE